MTRFKSHVFRVEIILHLANSQHVATSECKQYVHTCVSGMLTQDNRMQDERLSNLLIVKNFMQEIFSVISKINKW